MNTKQFKQKEDSKMRMRLTAVALLAAVTVMGVCTQQVDAALWAQWLLNGTTAEEIQEVDAVVQGGSGATYVGSPGGQALQLDDEYLQLKFSGGLGDVAEGFWDDSSVAYWVKYDGTASNTYNSLLTNSHNEFGNRLVNHLKGSAGTNRAFANLCGTGPGDSGCSGGPNDVAADTWAHLCLYQQKGWCHSDGQVLCRRGFDRDHNPRQYIERPPGPEIRPVS